MYVAFGFGAPNCAKGPSCNVFFKAHIAGNGGFLHTYGRSGDYFGKSTSNIHMAVQPFWGARQNRYSDILKQGLGNEEQFEFALYPPVPRAFFDLKTLFTYGAHGIVHVVVS